MYDLRRVIPEEAAKPEPVDNERDYRRDVRDKRAAVKALVLKLVELANTDLSHHGGAISLILGTNGLPSLNIRCAVPGIVSRRQPGRR